jgi:hypothetical protein
LFLKPSHAGGFKGYALDYSLPLPYPLLHTSMLNHPLSLSFLANHTFLFHPCQSPKSKANPLSFVSSDCLFNNWHLQPARCMLPLDPLYVMGGSSRLASPKQFGSEKIESVDGFMVGMMQEQTGSGHETE